MNIALPADGMIDGAVLLDVENPRLRHEIVALMHVGSRVGLVRRKKNIFIAEFLGKARDPHWSLDHWDGIRTPCVCGTLEEASTLVTRYVANEEKA